uniref:NADH dehydrogenase [ubiquinone] 1 beta subcomplex subunit 6 n=1 Tax=Agkistrodon contortrix contortrix TaxID=8713 RepID=A0A1W7RFG4_AGKCO
MPERHGTAKMSRGSGLQPRDLPEEVIGYTPEEKLRLQQLRELRRRWLKDQELSPREPVLPPRKVGWVEGFWERFLQPERLWKRQVFKLYNAGKFSIINLFIPLWLAHYIVKYHVQVTPHGIVEKKHSIYPGDRMEEKGIPPSQGTSAEIPICED